MSEALSEAWLPIIAMACVVVGATVILLATRGRNITFFKERETPKDREGPAERAVPSRPPAMEERSIPSSQADKAREDLRILGLEKEVVGFALTRLYEAEAAGTITKEDQVKLLEKYGAEMKQLDKQINTKEMIVKLFELEGTQNELIQMFNDRLVEIDREIKNMRAALGLIPAEEAPKEEAKPAKPKKKEDQKSPPPRTTPRKTEAEQKLEAIQEEVLKALEKLEQIEIEG